MLGAAGQQPRALEMRRVGWVEQENKLFGIECCNWLFTICIFFSKSVKY